MNYIKHLTGFFDKVINDKNLNPTHISLYIALFQGWNCNRFRNTISINRDEIMRISKISSKATYHKCLKALHTQGYINYDPSYNPYRGSLVYLFNFADEVRPMTKAEIKASSIFLPVDEQVADKSQTANETTAEPLDEQVLVPSINNTNITNNSNITKGLNGPEPEKKIEESHQDLKTQSGQEKEKGSAEKEKEEMPDQVSQQNKKMSSPAFADYTAEQTETSQQKSSAQKEKVFDEHEINYEVDHSFDTSELSSRAQSREVIPTNTEVLAYFHSQNFQELEAHKFYNYFNSIGWLVGGKTKMVDWHSAAQNWILNAPKFQPEERPPQTKTLHTPTDKNYAEPL